MKTKRIDSRNDEDWVKSYLNHDLGELHHLEFGNIFDLEPFRSQELQVVSRVLQEACRYGRKCKASCLQQCYKQFSYFQVIEVNLFNS